MSDEQRQPETSDVQIPDGGLGNAMPIWLQQPPAWKRQPVEVPAPTRILPPPDVSVIDPRAMLDVDDLPRWLQTLARPSAGEIVQGAADDESVVDLVDDDPALESKVADADSVGATHGSTPPQEEWSAEAGGRPLAHGSTDAADRPQAGLERSAERLHLDGGRPHVADASSPPLTPPRRGEWNRGPSLQTSEGVATIPNMAEMEPGSPEGPGEDMVATAPAPANESVPVPAGQLPSPPWWLSDRVLGLILLGIVLAMIYVVLAVSGVI